MRTSIVTQHCEQKLHANTNARLADSTHPHPLSTLGHRPCLKLDTVVGVGRVRDGRVGALGAGNAGGIEARAALEAAGAVVAVPARDAGAVDGIVRGRPGHTAGNARVPAGPRGHGAGGELCDARPGVGQRAVYLVRIGQGLEAAGAVGVQAALLAL